MIELTKRESEKAQGTHISVLQFIIPKDIEPEQYKLTTTINMGEQKKVVSGYFIIR